MKVQELGIEEQARSGATHRVIIKPEDINGTGTGFGALSAASAASTTGTLTPFGALPAGYMVQFVQGYLKAAFVPASSTALTLTIGYDISSGTDKSAGFQLATSICSTATPIPHFPAEIAAPTGSYTAAEQAEIAALIAQCRKTFTTSITDTVQVLFTSTTANLTDYVAAGEVHLYFRLWDLPNAA